MPPSPSSECVQTLQLPVCPPPHGLLTNIPIKTPVPETSRLCGYSWTDLLLEQLRLYNRHVAFIDLPGTEIQWQLSAAVVNANKQITQTVEHARQAVQAQIGVLQRANLDLKKSIELSDNSLQSGVSACKHTHLRA